MAALAGNRILKEQTLNNQAAWNERKHILHYDVQNVYPYLHSDWDGRASNISERWFSSGKYKQMIKTSQLNFLLFKSFPSFNLLVNMQFVGRSSQFLYTLLRAQEQSNFFIKILKHKWKLTQCPNVVLWLLGHFWTHFHWQEN